MNGAKGEKGLEDREHGGNRKRKVKKKRKREGYKTPDKHERNITEKEGKIWIHEKGKRKQRRDRMEGGDKRKGKELEARQ